MLNTHGFPTSKHSFYDDHLALVKFQDDLSSIKGLIYYYDDLISGLSRQSLDINTSVIPYDELLTIKDDLIQIRNTLSISIHELREEHTELKEGVRLESISFIIPEGEKKSKFKKKTLSPKHINSEILKDLKNDLEYIQNGITNYEILLTKGKELQLNLTEYLVPQDTIEQMRSHLAQLRNKVNTSVFTLGSNFSSGKEQIDREIHLKLMRMGVG